MYLTFDSKLVAMFGKAGEWLVGGASLEEVAHEEHPEIL